MASKVTLPSDSAIKKFLGAKADPALPGTRRCIRMHVGAVRLQQTRLRVVSQIGLQYLAADTVLQHWVLNGKDGLHAFVQISRHPIGAAQIDFLFAAIGKVKYPLVFQKASHNAAHADVIADTAHSRSQSAYPTHDEIDLNPRLRRTVQLANDVEVE